MFPPCRDLLWPPALTGAQLKALRSRSGLGPARFGAAIGYGGKSHTIARTVRRLEGRADEPVPADVAARAAKFERELDRKESRWAEDAKALLAKNAREVALERRRGWR